MKAFFDYWKLPNENYIVKMIKDEGLFDDCDIKNILPAHLGAFILSNSKQIMNKLSEKSTDSIIKYYIILIVIHRTLKRKFGMC